MDLRNSNGSELKIFSLQLYGSFFRKFSSEVKKYIFKGFPMYVAQCSFTEMKNTFIKLQNEPLPKDVGQVLLAVNNSV